MEGLEDRAGTQGLLSKIVGILFRQQSKIRLWLFVGLFALMGGVTLLLVKGLSPATSLEAEQGSGVFNIIDDSNASNGHAVLFGGSVFPAATNVVAQPANSASAQISWTAPAPATPGWMVTTFDSSTGEAGSNQCWSCSTIRVSGLIVGHSYYWKVVPLATTASRGVGRVAGSTTVSNTIPASADAPPQAVTDINLTAVPDDQWLTISWQPNTNGNAADYVTVNVFDNAGNKVGGVGSVDAYEGSRTIPLSPGTYYMNIYAQNSAGNSGPATSKRVQVVNSCSTADICLNVASKTTRGNENLLGQGFLHSYILRTGSSGPYVDPALTAALHPQQWRLSTTDLANNQLIAGYGPKITHIISDNWFNYTAGGNGGYAVTPWSDWDRYSKYVSHVVSNAEAQGYAPTYWDLFNEPDVDNYFSPADNSTKTLANYLQTMLVEYQAVKAADPAAKVVAPSLAEYSEVPDGKNIDMGTFIRFAAQHGMVLDAISWHENSPSTGGPDWSIRSAPWNVTEHIAQARKLIAQNPAVGDPVILINEYTTTNNWSQPAWNLGYWTAFENANIGGASRTCWNDACSYPSLDGLLVQTTPSNWTGTLPVYWAAKAYADMKDGTRVPLTSTASAQMDGLAVRQDTTSTIRALVGVHTTSGGAKSTHITIDWPYTAPYANVTLTNIPSNTLVSAGPIPVSSIRVSTTGGQITVDIPAAVRGEAYSIVATATN